MEGAHVRALAHGFIAVLLLSIGCGRKPVHRPGEEYLQAIRIEGNDSIDADDLRKGLALQRVLKQGSSPDPYLVVIDGQRIRGEYLRRGFLEVDVRSRVERHGDATTVIYTVQEGPRAKTRVMLTGIPEGEPELRDEVREALPLEDGEYFSYEPYDEAKERLLGIVENAGFAHATLDAHVIADRANHLAIVHLAYQLGPKSRFGTVEVSGVSGQLADAIRARVAFESGDVYSAEAIAETQRALYGMGRFSTVRVVPDKDGGDVIDVSISVARSAGNELALGGGIGSDPAAYEVRARTNYTKVGWPFPLTDFRVDLRPAYARLRDDGGSEPRIRALANLRRIDLFRPFVTGEIEGGYTYLTWEAYTSYGPIARLGIESPIVTKALRLRVGWQLEYQSFRQISPLIDETLQMQLGLDRSQRVGQFTQAAVLDLRDNPIEPRLGIYAELRVDEGTQLAGSGVEFYRATPELRGFVPVPVPGIGLVLAARARAGRIWGDVPVTERYFSGGSTTQRGFGERRLAPTLVGEVDGDVREVPIGGAELAEASIELRTKLATIRDMGVGGATFLDGGDVSNRGELDLGNLHWAAGLGLRLYTVIGAVRADLGYRLNRTGPGEPQPGSRWAFHFSIGEAF